jgi:hypothetical protein
MKKVLVFLTIAVVAFAALGAAGLAYAQGQTPQPPTGTTAPGTNGQPFSYGQGLGAGRGFRGQGGIQGRMGGFHGQAITGTTGPLHDYMEAAIAQVFGLSADELDAIHTSGSTLFAYVQEKGVTAEQFAELMSQARSQALSDAVEAGAITQQQADFMTQRWQQAQANGYGPGSANCTGLGPAAGRGMGWRWNQTATQP